MTHAGGSIGLVLLIALLLVGAAGGLLFIGPRQCAALHPCILAVLAMIGVFLLFALAAGILRATAERPASPLLKDVVDSATDGILVTDAKGRVTYANAAYLALVGASATDDVRPVERVFIGDPGISEIGLSAAQGGPGGAAEGRRRCAWARTKARKAAGYASGFGRSPGKTPNAHDGLVIG